MAAINFYLDKKQSKEPTYIILSFIDQGHRIRISSGEKILPKHWDAKKQKAKRTFSNSIALNAYLNSFSEDVQKIYLEAKAQGIIANNKYIKTKLKEQYNPGKKVEKTFLEIYDQFIEESKTTRATGTIKNYRTLKIYLKEFQEKQNYKLSFESLDFIFRDQFRDYLLVARKVSDSTVSQSFSVLKRFLNYATERELNHNKTYLQFKFREKPSTRVALTEEEVTALEELDLSLTPRLEKVRDIFLFGCETSLRHSDINNLKWSNIKATEIDGELITHLDLVAQKTRGAIQAPLSQKAIKILNKYKTDDRITCFPLISNQKFNSYIKEAARLAGIASEVEVISFAGNQRKEAIYPKYKLIGSHTARRTFVTLFFERSESITACMVYTGHKSFRELEAYHKKTLKHKLKLVRNVS